MPPLSDIGPLAAQSQPIFQADPGASPEDHLMAAFEAARAALSVTLPKGTTLDALAAKVGDETYTDQLSANVPQIQAGLTQGTDLADANGVSIKSNSCRQYYLNKYLIACDGLGVYASGFGKQMDASGTFPGNYAQSIDDKIRAFSEITHAQETGQLVHLVNAESVAAAAAATSGLSGYRPVRTRLIIGTNGTRIETIPAGGVGLGFTGVEEVFITVIIIGLIAGTVVWALAKDSIEATAATNDKICSAAMTSGNAALAQQCIDIAKKATNLGVVGQVLGDAGTQLVSSLGKYLFIGGAAVLGIYFLPQIMGSALKTKDVYEAHKAARAAANRRRYR